MGCLGFRGVYSLDAGRGENLTGNRNKSAGADPSCYACRAPLPRESVMDCFGSSPHAPRVGIGARRAAVREKARGVPGRRLRESSWPQAEMRQRLTLPGRRARGPAGPAWERADAGGGRPEPDGRGGGTGTVSGACAGVADVMAAALDWAGFSRVERRAMTSPSVGGKGPYLGLTQTISEVVAEINEEGKGSARFYAADFAALARPPVRLNQRLPS